MKHLPALTVLSLALLSVTALASDPAPKTKKHRPQRPTYSAADPFATKDPFTTALKASTSTTAHKTTSPAPLSTPTYSNPYLNLNPKTTPGTPHIQPKD
jgi:hypothetical protein